MMGRLVSLLVPGHNNRSVSVVLGFPGVDGYMHSTGPGPHFFGHTMKCENPGVALRE